MKERDRIKEQRISELEASETKHMWKERKTLGALRASEQKYRTIFENSVEGIFQSTPEGRYISVNPALARMIGYDSPEEMMQSITNIAEQAYVNPEDRARYRELIEEQGVVEGFEMQHYRKDGSKIWVSLNSRVVKDATGKPFYYEGTIEDITRRKQAEEELKQTLEKLRKSLAGTIQAMAATIEIRDPYITGHQKRVSNLAHTIAQEMGLPNDMIEGIRMAGTIHDIGKISVPAETLSKPTELSDMEFGIIKVHPQTGYDILKEIDFPWPIAQIVLQHHERLDGSGYPQGLKGDHILLEAKILSVADVVEAMSSYRPYRPALGIDAALNEIEQNKGVLYDTEAVDICLKLFKEKGFRFE
jgi:PAS domain S-box-containing protein/putative nucleotidyltransferase with HDIG domain